MILPPRAPLRSMAWATVWILACVLLLAQTLGLTHGLVHGPQAQGAGHRQAAHQPVHAAVAGPGAFGLASLFSSHDSDTDCRLFDQASHGSAALGIVTLSLPMVLSSLVFDITRGDALARWAALFDARGPPLTR
ncbi:MAG: hypothetical protein ABIR56_00655 [Polaromonas sp.]